MTKNPRSKSEPSTLRQEAEKLLQRKSTKSHTGLQEAETMELIHELEVHQIELELQNEDLVQMRAAAQDAANKYTELYDFAPLGYVTLTSEGRVRQLNFCAAQMIGKERSFVNGVYFTFFITPDTKHAFNDFLEKIFSSRVKESCDVTLSLPGNLPMYVHMSGIVTPKGDQCLINIVDVTERRQAEKSIMETQRLKVIGEMASSVAHDFKNSLQSISGNLELAMFTKDVPEAAMEYLRAVRTAVEDAAARVRLLQRYDGNKQDTAQYTHADLNAMICEVITQSRPLWKDEAEKKGLAISIETSLGELPEVFVHKEELRTVLYNILKNSIEAMPRGGRIYIETTKKTNGVYVSITDTGVGMDEETLCKIFQPFYSTKGFDVGRGLGMSNAYTIIKEHRGSICVKYSKPGEGTSIEIVLPYSANVSKAEKKKLQIEEQPSKKSLRILWVEDEVSISTLVKEMVLIFGHEIDVANNGKEALECLEHNTYDLVITDIGMPGINGWQLTGMIREKYGNTIKVAIASGWGDQFDNEQKKAYGIISIIDKPFNMARLNKLFSEITPPGK